MNLTWTLSPLLEPVPRWLLTYSLHSAVLAAVGLLLARFWLAPGSRRSVVLRVALFGGLASASLPWKALEPLRIHEASAASVPVLAQGTAGALATGMEWTTSTAMAPPRAGAPVALRDTAEPSPLAFDTRWLLLVLAAGSVLLVGRLALQRARFLRSLERAPLGDAAGQGLLDAWTAEQRIGRVLLCASGRLRAPIVLSSREICVPRSCWDALRGAERRALLAHEFAHIERRDPLWFTAAAVVESVFFFLPWHRMMRHSLNASAEVACDARAARRVGSPTAVARCLAAVASWSARMPVGSPVPASVPAMAARPGELVDRVQHLLADEERPVGRRFAIGALTALVGFACCAPAVTTGKSTAEQNGATGVRVAGDIEVAVAMDGTATARRSPKYPAMEPIEVQLKGREGKEQLQAWLDRAAMDLPPANVGTLKDESTPRDWVIHGGSLTVVADSDVEMKYALWIMSMAGDRDVSMPDVRIRVDGRTYRTPLPVDLAVTDMALVPKLDVRLDAVDPSDPGKGDRKSVV